MGEREEKISTLRCRKIATARGQVFVFYYDDYHDDYCLFFFLGECKQHVEQFYCHLGTFMRKTTGCNWIPLFFLNTHLFLSAKKTAAVGLKVERFFGEKHGHPRDENAVTFLSSIIGGHKQPLKRSRELTIPKRSLC